ncbi:MAG: hypothetical protein IKR28_02025 [Selenomonadaceae bacterium]|nr:hypothetical protein [Selenomonadaceae bacterium]
MSIVVLTMVLPAGGLSAQETLKASRVEARGARRHLPALGVPEDKILAAQKSLE